MSSKISALLKTAVITASVLFTANVVQAEEFKLRWGHYLPNSAFVQVEKDFAKKIEERTKGRVKIDIVFAGGLGKGNEVALLAGRGAIDMASVAMGYYPDQLLFWKAYQIPFIFDDPVQAINIVHKSYKKFPIFSCDVDGCGQHMKTRHILATHKRLKHNILTDGKEVKKRYLPIPSDFN